ncbi:hypothetical protein HDV00_010262 [Rhizophlyctis rosea]|nr:hypothetical protein HDV00_010262 [Rhizophlyctis rosea]
MGDLTTANFASDSEDDDEDFIPDNAADQSDSGSSDSDDSETEAADGSVPAKRRSRKRQKGKKKQKQTAPGEDPASLRASIEAAERAEQERKAKINDIWSSMRTDDGATKKSSNYLAAYEASLNSKTNKVTKTYQFAGRQFSIEQSITPTLQSEPLAPQEPPPGSTTPTAPKARKSRLMEIAEKFGVAHEAAKLTVLEKSKLDWVMHVDESGDAERLQHHRKDGYLEKHDFLSRMDQRQAEHLQSLKRTGRRR